MYCHGMIRIVVLSLVNKLFWCHCAFLVRFNTGPNVNAGGLEVHRDGKWYGVCDTGFSKAAAMVACRSIRKDFIDATVIPGIDRWSLDLVT